jgi:sRNA-binding protein
MSAENDSPEQVLEVFGTVDTLPPAMSPADCQRELAQRFPALFGLDSGPQPIKLRIHVDIQAQAPGVFTRRSLAHFLSRHTTSTAYLKALVKAPHRLDLKGAPAGEIAEEHRQAAQVELDRRKALVAERRRALGREDSRHHQPPRHPPTPQKRPGPQPRVRPPQKTLRAQEAQAAQGAQEAQQAQQHADLLRAFESSPLSKANFCTLKGLRESQLDEALALAAKKRRA